MSLGGLSRVGTSRPLKIAPSIPNCSDFVAKRMGATTSELRSSHVPMLSQPQPVLDVIRNAAKAIQKSKAA